MIVRLAALFLAASGLAALRAPAPLSPDAALHLYSDTTRLMLLMVLAWLALSLLAGWMARLPGTVGRLAHAGWRLLVPRVLRLSLVALVSVPTVVAPALASEPAEPVHPPTVGRPDPSAPVSAGQRPESDSPRDSARPAQRSTAEPAKRATVTVAPGDSLWRIAERQLGSQASVPTVAQEWPRWYRTNRATIGPDPDLLQIGTVLTAPRPERPTR